MTDYADLKVAPLLRDVLKTAAELQYGEDYRAISRAGHEAVIAWLVLRADGDVVDQALAEHGFEDIDALIAALADDDGEDGRFSGDEHFDPLAAIRTGSGDD